MTKAAQLGRASLKTADVVVIGGGAVGTAVAYFLARENMDVMLVERQGIGAGTSARCDGAILVCDTVPGYDFQLKKAGQDLFTEVARSLDDDIEWRQTGSLMVIENELEWEVAQKHCRQLSVEGLSQHILDRSRARAAEPYLAEDIAGAVETPGDGTLNPMALTCGLAHKAQKLGARVLPCTSVNDIQRKGRRGDFQIHTDRGIILSPKVVNAAGIWAPEIGRLVGLQIPITPRQGHLLAVERTFPLLNHRFVHEYGYALVKTESRTYRRQIPKEMEQHGVAFVMEATGAHNFLIGSSRCFVGRDITTNRDVLRCIARRAIRFFPALKGVNVIRTWAGLRPYTPDHLPIISGTKLPGFYIAAGHEGSGIMLSLITGKLMRQIILGQPTAIDTSPLRFERFAETLSGPSANGANDRA